MNRDRLIIQKQLEGTRFSGDPEWDVYDTVQMKTLCTTVCEDYAKLVKKVLEKELRKKNVVNI